MQPNEVASENAKQKLRDWYYGVVLQRLLPGGVIVVVMHRLAPDDLTATLVEDGGWSQIALPLIEVSALRYYDKRDRTLMRRAPGDLLNPGWLTSGGCLRGSRVCARLSGLNTDQLRLQWRNHLGGVAPAHLPGWLLLRVLAYRIQAAAFGNLDRAILRRLHEQREDARPFATRGPTTREGVGLKSGALLVREWNGRRDTRSRGASGLAFPFRPPTSGLGIGENVVDVLDPDRQART